jgi:hypothetical protein
MYLTLPPLSRFSPQAAAPSPHVQWFYQLAVNLVKRAVVFGHDLGASDLAADCFANSCSLFCPHPAEPRLRIRSRGRLCGPAVVEHDEAATKATRVLVLVGVNRG